MDAPTSLTEGLGVARQTKSRFGCLGCLGQLALISVLGLVLMVAITGIFAPWGFYLGGKFRWFPEWQGFGTMHAKSGKYVIYVRFQPRPAGQHILPESGLGGSGYLCSPHHEIFYMKLGGSMRRGLSLNTDHEKISLYMNNHSSFLSNLNSDYRPRIELRGQWYNPNIVMDDHSSIQRSFEPDGTVYRGGGRNRPYTGEIVPVTLQPGSYSDFEAACKSLQ